MTVRLRIGIRLPLIPNAGIAVKWIDGATAVHLCKLVNEVKVIADSLGIVKELDRLVCEIDETAKPK